jgi:hypothetical protein
MPATIGISAASATTFSIVPLEAADHPRGEECRAQVDRQPQPAVLGGIPDAGEEVFLVAQAGLRKQVRFALLADHVDHLGHGQAAQQPSARVEHRRRHQVVSLEGLGRFRLASSSTCKRQHVGAA